MKVPAAVWFVFIPALVAGLVPVLTSFWPPATVWWSAALIAVGGAVVAAVQAWKDSQTQPKPPTLPEGVQPAAAPMVGPQKSFVRRWLVG
jgi:hypothetical protein